MNTVFANISKTIWPRSNSFLLIMSHIWITAPTPLTLIINLTNITCHKNPIKWYRYVITMFLLPLRFLTLWLKIDLLHNYCHFCLLLKLWSFLHNALEWLNNQHQYRLIGIPALKEKWMRMVLRQKFEFLPKVANLIQQHHVYSIQTLWCSITGHMYFQ